jgi:O-succinylbenzoate synthase
VALGDDDRWGLGDAAPLPGLSHESLEEVERALERCRELRAEPATLLDSLPPSLATALDAALLDLRAPSGVPAVLETSLLWQDEGHLQPPPGRVLKLKVGRRPLKEECSLVSHFAAAGVRLRLDGNRRLDRVAAGALVTAAGDALDFFEEPGPGLTAGTIGARVALDESLDEACLEATADADAAVLDRALRPRADAAVWVVKPTVIGPRFTRQLARLAADRGITVVLSSAYDSSVGRRGLVRLGVELGLGSAVHGLGTGALLSPDLEALPGPVLVEEDGFVWAGAPLSPDAFSDLAWREVAR